MKTINIYPSLLFFSILVFIASCLTPLSAQTSLFYGMTSHGGSNDSGAIISFNPSNNTEHVVYSFKGAALGDGTAPWGDLVYHAGNGLFYGMTYGGGSHHSGTIISFNPVSNAENVLWNFGNGTDGANPFGDLVYDEGNGLFYAMTYDGGSHRQAGAIISFNPANDSENVAYSFNGIGYLDGAEPSGNLVYDAGTGLYYGMTAAWGNHGYGAIISFNPANNVEDMVYSFFGAPSDGASPAGDLVYDPGNGLYYGMTFLGGSNNMGAIISYNASDSTEYIVYSFLGNRVDGANPHGDLVYNAANGLFYGLTQNGGSSNEGAIISFKPDSNIENVVWSFGSPGDGGSPDGNLVYDAGNGLYYAMTEGGGSHGLGAIISFKPDSNTENVVWSFGSDTDGAIPYGSLARSSGANDINAINNTNVAVNIYPNPASDMLFIKADGWLPETLELYDVNGGSISKTPFKPRIDVTKLAAGVYFVELKTSASIVRKRFVRM